MILDDVTQQVGRQVETSTWELAGWLDRVAPVFARPEPRELLRQMTVGLLSPLPKKNGWTLAEAAGHTHPGRIQTFLCRGAWDAVALEGHVRDLVVETLGDPEDGVLIVDDTQIIKKGTKSVGVAPQHCGATNQIENCQVIVMLAYARLRRSGAAGTRSSGTACTCPNAGPRIPTAATRPASPRTSCSRALPRQAVELFQEAEDAGVPYGWIAADGGYGQYREVRDWPTERSKRYVMAVPSTQPLARVHAIAAHSGKRSGRRGRAMTCWPVPRGGNAVPAGTAPRANGPPIGLTGRSSPSPCPTSHPPTGTPTP